MSELPYTTGHSKLKIFLEKIPETGTPQKVSQQELAARGFKSSNDRSIVPVLKDLKLIDSSGSPTANWMAYRDRRSNRQLLASLLRQTYQSIYAVYPDAHLRSDSDIRNLMATKTRSGERVVQAMLSTFRTLCSLADFAEGGQTSSDVGPPVAPTQRGNGAEPASAEDEMIYLDLKHPRVRLSVRTPITEQDKVRIVGWFATVAEPWLGFHVEDAAQSSG